MFGLIKEQVYIKNVAGVCSCNKPYFKFRVLFVMSAEMRSITSSSTKVPAVHLRLAICLERMKYSSTSGYKTIYYLSDDEMVSGGPAEVNAKSQAQPVVRRRSCLETLTVCRFR